MPAMNTVCSTPSAALVGSRPGSCQSCLVGVVAAVEPAQRRQNRGPAAATTSGGPGGSESTAGRGPSRYSRGPPNGRAGTPPSLQGESVRGEPYDRFAALSAAHSERRNRVPMDSAERLAGPEHWQRRGHHELASEMVEGAAALPGPAGRTRRRRDRARFDCKAPQLELRQWRS